MEGSDETRQQSGRQKRRETQPENMVKTPGQRFKISRLLRYCILKVTVLLF